MTSKTHKKGGLVASIVGFYILKKYGLLLGNVDETLQLLIMYPFTQWGSTACDLDHCWDNCPSRDTASWLINKGLHLTTKTRDVMQDTLHISNKRFLYRLLGIFDASHRSWQTHSDITILTSVGFIVMLLSGKFFSMLPPVDSVLLILISMGILIGVIAHFLLDMLTPSGIHLMTLKGINNLISKLLKRKVKLLPEKIRLVPDSPFFATGGNWESIVSKVLSALKVVLVAFFLLDGLDLFEITFTG